MNEWDEYAVLEAELGSRAAADLMAENAVIPELRANVILRKLEDACITPIASDDRPDIVGWYVGLDGDDEKGNTYEVTGVSKDGRIEADLIWTTLDGSKAMDTDPSHWRLPVSRIDWGWDPVEDSFMLDPVKLDKMFSDREAT